MSSHHPQHHISHLAIDDNGWIVPAASSSTTSNNNNNKPIIVSQKCHQLLAELKLDISDDIFTKNRHKEVVVSHDSTAALTELSHSLKLADLLRGLIAEIRRMGSPSPREKSTSNNNDNDDEEDDKEEDGNSKQSQNTKNKKSRKNRRVRGKVAQLEEQRRLRLEQEAQKTTVRESESNGDNDDDNDDTTDGDNEVDAFEEDEEDDEDGGGSDNDDNEASIINEETEASANDNDDDNDTQQQQRQHCSSSDSSQLAITFNSLRVLITILRPILDHPYQKDDKLCMKHGPTINSKKKFDHYMFSTHVYSCVSKGAWNETRTSFIRLLNEVEPGLFHKVMMKKKKSVDDDDDRSSSNSGADEYYEFNIREWIEKLFNYDRFSSREYVMKQCLGEQNCFGNNTTNGKVNFNSNVVQKFNEVLLNRFQNDGDEMKQRKLQDSIRNLQVKLSKAISRNFPGATLTVYGSCLSGLALEGSHDVDVSVYIPQLDHLKQDFDVGIISAREYEQKMKRIVYRIKGTLQYCRSKWFDELFAIPNARVPVVKGKDVHARNPFEDDGSLAFDLCFLNDIAVVNSSLLREYSLFDNRVRILMLSIKSFAKLNNIASAADGTLSSYSWLNLVVFYLQCIGFLPNLQCKQLMHEHGFKPDQSRNRWHGINGLETYYLTKDTVTQKQVWEPSPQCKDVNVPMLLYGFFNFYSTVFPQQAVAASIRLGEISLQKTSFHNTSKIWRMCIEDPFETYFSHCPHDLGCHLKETGQEQMYDHLDRMRNDLEYLLKQEQPTDDLVNTFMNLLCSLGPGASAPKKKKQPKSKKGNDRKPTGGTGGKGKGAFNGKCDGCHQFGHKRADCPLRSKGKNDDKPSFKGRCDKCHQIGHKKVDCPQNSKRTNDKQAGSGGRRGSNMNHTYSKKFVERQEERLLEISKLKEKESKSGV